MKKLLAIAVSGITYLRGIFPGKAYGRKYVEGQITYEPNLTVHPISFQVHLPGKSSIEHSRVLFFLFRSASDDPQRGAQLSWCHSDSSVVNYSSLTFASKSCLLGSLKPNRHHLVESYQLLHFDVPVLILSSSVIPLTKSVRRQTPTEVLYDSSRFSRCHQNYVLPQVDKQTYKVKIRPSYLLWLVKN